MIKTVKQSRIIMNALPAAGVGLLSMLLVVPLLPSNLSATITSSSLWGTIQQFHAGIVALAAVICLLFLWSQRPKHQVDEKHGKKHK
jgi:hypothetical protein